MAPEANTFPHWSQDHPVSPVWVFMRWCSDLVLLKHWWHSSQLVSPACTSGTSKGTSSRVAPEARTFLPASISFRMPWALFRSFLGTFMKPSSTSGAVWRLYKQPAISVQQATSNFSTTSDHNE